MRRKPRKKLPVERRQETPAESTGQLLWLGFAVLVAALGGIAGNVRAFQVMYLLGSCGYLALLWAR